jgi:hypothetical protein
MPALAKVFGDKKYMWDGEVYTSEEEAKKIAQRYEGAGFETKIVFENNQFFVYSRKEVK